MKFKLRVIPVPEAFKSEPNGERQCLMPKDPEDSNLLNLQAQILDFVCRNGIFAGPSPTGCELAVAAGARRTASRDQLRASYCDMNSGGGGGCRWCRLSLFSPALLVSTSSDFHGKHAPYTIQNLKRQGVVDAHVVSLTDHGFTMRCFLKSRSLLFPPPRFLLYPCNHTLNHPKPQTL